MDARSDLFSLGVVLYEMLTARTPFEGSVFDVLRQIATEAPPPMSVRAPEVTVPPELERVVMKLMAANPAERYASAAEVIADLEAAMPARRSVGRRTSAEMALSAAPAALPIDDEPAPPVTAARAGRRAASDTGEMLALVKRHRRVLGAVVMTGVALAIAGVVVTLVLRDRDQADGDQEEAPALAAAAPAPSSPAAPVHHPGAGRARRRRPAAPRAGGCPTRRAPVAAAAAGTGGRRHAEAARRERKGRNRSRRRRSGTSRRSPPPGPGADELYRDGTRLYLKGQLGEARKKYEAALAQEQPLPGGPPRPRLRLPAPRRSREVAQAPQALPRALAPRRATPPR